MRLRLSPLFFAIVVSASVAALALAAPRTGAEPAIGAPQPAPALRDIDAWLNSPPLELDALRGKVVLVDFWTYSCINCLNHLPSVQSWHQKYADKGLVVIGVHTPEFPFEKSTKNVEKAIARLGIKHAVAQDNRYGTWRAFGNQYWPAIYLIDKQGRVAYSHFGEGRYAETEKKIRELLAQPSDS